MNKFAKFLLIVGGVLIATAGVGTGAWAVLDTGSDTTTRAGLAAIAVALLLLGWWLVRRASDSVLDAITWLFALMP